MKQLLLALFILFISVTSFFRSQGHPKSTTKSFDSKAKRTVEQLEGGK